MKERPIIFSGAMVRALLDGTKTQTRRVIKLRHDWQITERDDGSLWPWHPDYVTGGESDGWAPCPYGRPGDRLWVREGWADEHPLSVQDGRFSQQGQAGIPGPPPVTYRTIYRADGEPLQVWRNADQSHPYFTLSGPADEIAERFPTVSSNYTRDGKGIHWESPIHMPRRASRITLEITDVRVQRLQETSEDDCGAEGIYSTEFYDRAEHKVAGGAPWSVERLAFADLWQSINGAGSWDANPWVWALTFRRVRP